MLSEQERLRIRVSQNAAAKKFSCLQSYINKVVATKCNLRCFKKSKITKIHPKKRKDCKKDSKETL